MTWRQSLAPMAGRDFRGSLVAIPAGQVLAGFAAEAFGARAVIFSAAALYVGIGAVTLFTPAVWRLRAPETAAV